MKIERNDRPAFSESDATAIAKAKYGLSATAVELPSERDRNFLIKDGGGARYVLKIASSLDSHQLIEFQNAFISHINAHGSEVTIPHVIKDVDGKEIGRLRSTDGEEHLVRLLSYLPGRPLASLNFHEPGLLTSLGRFIAELTNALEGFDHEAAHRDFHWDLFTADKIIAQYVDEIGSKEKRELVAGCLERFNNQIKPRLTDLPRSIIHSDANDYNLLVSSPDRDKNSYADPRICGLIDFGDAVYSTTINELAVAVAYAMLGKPNPFNAAAEVVSGYHQVRPLSETEAAIICDLAFARLALSVTIAAHQRKLDPDNKYLSVTESDAWELLLKANEYPPAYAASAIRAACGYGPTSDTLRLSRWLSENAEQFVPVLRDDIVKDCPHCFDLSMDGQDVGNLADSTVRNSLPDRLAAKLKESGVACGLIEYGSTGPLVSSSEPTLGDHLGDNGTINLGINILTANSLNLTAFIDGQVHSLFPKNNRDGLRPCLVMRHEPDNDLTFYSIYRGDFELNNLALGAPVKRGEALAKIVPTSGHLSNIHLQLAVDLPPSDQILPARCSPDDAKTYLSLCPDPSSLLGLHESTAADSVAVADTLEQKRSSTVGPSLSISYNRHLTIVRGAMQYLYAADGRCYLDGVNNVPHVGHCHPAIVEAARRQSETLNTNTRYLNRNLTTYVEKLLSYFPKTLSVCYLVCSGSEANELALRLARAHTGAHDVIVVDAAYHGNTGNLVDMSAYKHAGPGGKGRPDWVHVVPLPDPYRGQYKGHDNTCGEKYAHHVTETIESMERKGPRPPAFFCESLPGCGGQIVLPDGYLRAAYEHVRKAGGVCVADEVQCGFGRIGSHFWGFELQGVVPDIVTLGKPIGNGHPLAAVITTLEIAASFNTGMEYFNTFGGNTVSCAIGHAVLDVIEREGLQAHALSVGNKLMAALSTLKDKHELVGDVRGRGLFIGIELVRDRDTLEPAAAEASYIVERMKDHGILLSTDGPLHNVIKIKPPMPFNDANANYLADVLDAVMGSM